MRNREGPPYQPSTQSQSFRPAGGRGPQTLELRCWWCGTVFCPICFLSLPAGWSPACGPERFGQPHSRVELHRGR